MAVYGTRAGFVAWIGEKQLLSVADRDNDQELDAALLDDALQIASEIVDGYLAGFSNLAGIASVKQSTYWIAYELLHIGDQSTEDSRRGYDRAIKWLEGVRDGEISLPGQPPGGDDGVTDAGDPLCVAGAERAWTQRSALRVF